MHDRRGGGAFEMDARQDDSTSFTQKWPASKQKAAQWPLGEVEKIFLHLGVKSRRSSEALARRIAAHVKRMAKAKANRKGKGAGKGKSSKTKG